MGALRAALAVKMWSKKAGVSGAPNGFLSSYGWSLMVIFYLQMRKVIPSLQDPRLNKEKGVSGIPADCFDTSFCEDVSVAQKFHASQNATDDTAEPSLGELLSGFFFFYGYEFDYEKLLVCPRLGKAISKQDRDPGIEMRKPWRFMIEDPFELQHNTAHIRAGA